jgi:hypothetical protein
MLHKHVTVTDGYCRSGLNCEPIITKAGNAKCRTDSNFRLLNILNFMNLIHVHLYNLSTKSSCATVSKPYNNAQMKHLYTLLNPREQRKNIFAFC